MSLLFDGVNDWVDSRAGGAVVNWVNGAAVAFMSAWARVSVAGVIGNMVGTSINNGGVATPDSRMSLERSAAGAIQTINRVPDGAAPQSLNDNGTGSLAVGVDTMVSVRTNIPGDSLQLQRDGVQTATAAVAFAPAAFDATGSASASLGSEEDGSGVFYGGRLEDCRVYNRNVPNEQIETIFACRGHDGIWDGCMARYMCNEGAPTVVAAGAGAIKDITDNQRHGTPTNGPTWQESVLSVRRRFT